MPVYTDQLEYFTPLLPNFTLLPLSELAPNLSDQSALLLLKNPQENINPKYFTITCFHHPNSDFQCNLPKDIPLLPALCKQFLELAQTDLISPQKSIPIEKTLPLKKPKTVLTQKYTKEEHVKGIFINGVRLSEGHLKFFPPLPILIAIFHNKFTGILKIIRQQTLQYSLTFRDGVLYTVASKMEADQLPDYLKQAGYLAANTQLPPNLSEQQIITLLIGRNQIFFHEPELILQDHKIWVLKQILGRKEGTFRLESLKNYPKSAPIDPDMFHLLAQFVRFLDPPNYDPQQQFSLIKEEIPKHPVISEVIKGLKINLSLNQLLKQFDAHLNVEIEQTLLFLEKLNWIKRTQADHYRTVPGDVTENIKARIDIWLEKIDHSNYFQLLDVDLNDTLEVITRKYHQIKEQFHRYLSSEVIRDQYEQSLDLILFEIDAAYTVLSREQMKQKYYDHRLED